MFIKERNMTTIFIGRAIADNKFMYPCKMYVSQNSRELMPTNTGINETTQLFKNITYFLS